MDADQGKKRKKLSYRVQPHEGSSLAEVSKWLNKMSTEEKNGKISQILLMTCLPLARADAGASQKEATKNYRQFLERLYKELD